jgi:RimJ/RimL family protein N-acetyltransferase
VTGPILFTDRLILRPLTGDDLDAWCAFHAEEDTMRFLGGAQPRPVAWR